MGLATSLSWSVEELMPTEYFCDLFILACTTPFENPRTINLENSRVHRIFSEKNTSSSENEKEDEKFNGRDHKAHERNFTQFGSKIPDIFLTTSGLRQNLNLVIPQLSLSSYS